jgi:iron complex transport system substrate-binding protein
MSKTGEHTRTNAEHCQGLAAISVGVALALTAGGAAAAQAPERVLSLDQCADQYVLALAPRESVVGLSHRADDGDSYMGAAAAGLPQRRISFESAFAARPDVVVRYWGGDPKLVRALEHRGVRVVTIEDAQDFEGVRANLRRVSAALNQPAAGERLAASMDADLQAGRGAWGGREALYLTPGGFTSGPGTLIDAMLRSAGLRNAAQGASFAPVPLERLVLTPPSAFVLGFFDMARFTRWDLAGHPVLERVRRGRTAASLPGKYLHCPAWFASEGARRLAEAAPAR